MRSNIDTAVTRDAFLGGRLLLLQPSAGHRSGSDAIFLAAAVPAIAGDRVLELGCGVGTALLALASRVPAIKGIGIEIEPNAASLALINVSDNELSDRLHIFCSDFRRMPPEAAMGGFSHVFANPPFFDILKTQPSPNAARRLARAAAESELVDWLKSAEQALIANGCFTLIFSADRIAELIALLPDTFGPIKVLPLLAGEGKAAKRAILQARKMPGRSIEILPGLILHQPNGAYTSAADQILRHGGALIVA